jgi:hypothetical protein
MNFRIVFKLTSGLASIALLFAMGSTLAMAQTKDSAEITKLLANAKVHAALAEYDSDTLYTFVDSPMAWESHAAQLRIISEHLNDLEKVVGQLNDLRGKGSPWQQVAIERINPLLRDMADNLNAAIKELKDHKERIQTPEYRDYLRANADLANRTATVISDFVEYSRAGAQSERLQKKLALPLSSKSVK